MAKGKKLPRLDVSKAGQGSCVIGSMGHKDDVLCKSFEGSAMLPKTTVNENSLESLMSMDAPTHTAEYRGYELVVNCYKLDSIGPAWEMSVEILDTEGGRVLPARRHHDGNYSTYEEAREAGVSEARRLIDQLVAASKQ